MKKISIILAIAALMMAGAPAMAQQFDTTAYQEHYKKRLDQVFYQGNYSTEDRIAGLSKAWAEARFGFANFDLVPDLDWDSLYHAFIPKVVEAENPVDYYRIMMNFYQHLGDGHTSIFPPKSLWDDMFSPLPVRCELIEGKVLITDVYSDQYPMLKPGQEVLRINGAPVEDYAARNVSPYMSFSTPQDSVNRLLSLMLFTGNIAEPIQLDLQQPDGRRSSTTVYRQKAETFFAARGDFRFKVLEGNIGYLEIPTFNKPEVLAYYEQIVPEMMKTDGLIIDIRKNGGGNGSYGHELIGYLSEQPFSQGVNVLRQYSATQRAWGMVPDHLKTLHYDWKPYKGIYYKKPVTVLIGPATYSAAEDFLVAFKSINRGQLIGQTTGGSTGQPLFFRMPDDGMGFVCSKRDLMADGTEFVGKGIAPDIWIDYSIQNYRKGKDEAVEKALELLRTQKVAKNKK